MGSMKTHRPRSLAQTATRVFIAAQAAEGLLLAPIAAEAHGRKWSALIAGALTTVVDADHYTIMQEPVAPDIVNGFFAP